MASSSSSSKQNESTKFSTALGNEKLTLELYSKTGELEIELANASRFVVHTKVISKEDEVREITGGFIDTPMLLFNFIRALFEEKSPSGSVEFNQKSSVLVIRTKLVLIPVTWTIQMKRLESNADVKCEFLVKQCAQLSAANKELADCVKSLKERIGLLAPENVERPVFAAVNNANVTLSADRKTVSNKLNLDSGWQELLSEHSIAAMGNKFTVLLNNMGANLMIGVARRATAPVNELFSQAGSWMLYLTSGSTSYFYGNGTVVAVTTRIAASNGSQLTVRLDPLNEQLYFRINGNLLYTADITKPFTDLYAAVDLCEASQSISFV